MELNNVKDYLVNETEVVVIGGMVLDINGVPSVVANARTTTPGKVLYALGGVARNIAECMSKLGVKPFMISALGKDFAGSLLLRPWKSYGLPLEGIQVNQHIGTAVICNIFDNQGELAAGVANAEAIEKFVTPEWIRSFTLRIESSPMLVIDANLSPAALLESCGVAAKCQTPVWFEPVSVLKSRRIASIAEHVTFTSPNEDELISMANALSSEDKHLPSPTLSKNPTSIESLFQQLKPAIWVLLEKGIRVVVVTLGPNGVFLCFKASHGVKASNFKKSILPSSLSRKLHRSINLACPQGLIPSLHKSKENYYIVVHFPALSASVIRLTGAGDCLVGGTVASICGGLDVMQSVAVGIASAKAAVETKSNVPDEYELTKIADDAASVYAQARVVFLESKL